jgi:hypothetical protein
VDRKRLTIGAAILITLALFVMAGVGVQSWRKNHQPEAHQKMLVSTLAYCGPDSAKPCVESFSVDADGNMLVNLLTPTLSYPDFYLTISKDSVTNNYECQKVEGSPTNAYCTGKEMYPGEALQFALATLEGDTVLAEGKFAIIGLLLPNPEGTATETPLATETLPATETPLATLTLEAVQTPTPILLQDLTPLPTESLANTPTPTEPTPSYPNPSYP